MLTGNNTIKILHTCVEINPKLFQVKRDLTRCVSSIHQYHDVMLPEHRNQLVQGQADSRHARYVI